MILAIAQQMGYFNFHFFAVNSMKHARRTKKYPWSDLEYQAADIDKNALFMANLKIFLDEEDGEGGPEGEQKMSDTPPQTRWDRLPGHLMCPYCHKILYTQRLTEDGDPPNRGIILLEEKDAQWGYCPLCQKRFIIVIEYHPKLFAYREEVEPSEDAPPDCNDGSCQR